MTLPDPSDIEEDDRCYVFGCTGHFEWKLKGYGEVDMNLVCTKCGVVVEVN